MTDDKTEREAQLPPLEATSTQTDRAHALAGLLNEGEEDGGLSVLDLLDALACLGLKLAPDEEGLASIAYMRELQRPRSEAAPSN